MMIPSCLAYTSWQKVVNVKKRGGKTRGRALVAGEDEVEHVVGRLDAVEPQHQLRAPLHPVRLPAKRDTILGSGFKGRSECDLLEPQAGTVKRIEIKSCMHSNVQSFSILDF